MMGHSGSYDPLYTGYDDAPSNVTMVTTYRKPGKMGFHATVGEKSKKERKKNKKRDKKRNKS